jgi:hypothetical protein
MVPSGQNSYGSNLLSQHSNYMSKPQDVTLKPTSEPTTPPAPPAPSVAEQMAELRAMASNIRTCIKNGHPHMMTHLDALLKKLGA